MRMVLFNTQDVYNYGYLQNTRQLLHLCRDSKDSQCKLTLENIFHMNTSLCCRFLSSLLFHCYCCWCFRLKSSYLHRWMQFQAPDRMVAVCISEILSLSLSEDEDCSLNTYKIPTVYVLSIVLNIYVLLIQKAWINIPCKYICIITQIFLSFFMSWHNSSFHQLEPNQSTFWFDEQSSRRS